MTIRRESDEPVELLLCDRAGEEYLDVADATELAKTLVELGRADTITVLVDGHRLVDVRERHNLTGELQMMLQAFKDGGALPGNQQCAIALTKLDEVYDSPSRARAESDFAALADSLRELFASKFARFETFRLAASPKAETETLKRGHGIAALLDYWMQPPKSGQLAGQVGLARSDRAFGRFAH